MMLSGIFIGAKTSLICSAKYIQYNHAVAGTALGEPPVAIIAYPANHTQMDLMDTVLFDGSTSYDPDGGLITYLWLADPLLDRWGNPPGSPETRHFFNSRMTNSGNYTITLIVTDNETLTDSMSIILHIIGEERTVTATTLPPWNTVESATVGTREKELLTVRPTFFPGFSVLPLFFALFITVILKRKMER